MPPSPPLCRTMRSPRRRPTSRAPHALFVNRHRSPRLSADRSGAWPFAGNREWRDGDCAVGFSQAMNDGAALHRILRATSIRGGGANLPSPPTSHRGYLLDASLCSRGADPRRPRRPVPTVIPRPARTASSTCANCTASVRLLARMTAELAQNAEAPHTELSHSWRHRATEDRGGSSA